MGGRRNLAGISLLEIIVSLMILALVLVGFSNVFVVSRGYMAHSRSRISASQLGTVFLEPLNNAVNQSNWDQAGNPLLVNPAGVGAARTIGGVAYTTSYMIDNITSTTLRRVKVNITWNESS